MLNKKTIMAFICAECGTEHSKWTGKCTGCGAWNSLAEESKIQKKYKFAEIASDNVLGKSSVQISKLDNEIENIFTIDTNIGEFNRVLGGGMVSGSAVLIGGDPGIGKSTLLLQCFVKLSLMGKTCVYISGEESVNQIKLRAKRLNLKSETAVIASATSLEEIKNIILKFPSMDLLIIDSIQTIYSENIPSTPGTVTQVRACAFELIRIAKTMNFTLFIVGHVTKEGNIAGPKVLEHMVDTVLYFEGDKGNQYRMIRAVKNRFGAANEIGVFEMREDGLAEVTNPSSVFLPENTELSSGSAIFAGIEGTRPLLIEIQALIAPSFLATPRRAVVGWDTARLAMMLAILNSRLGINLLDKEVYLNIVGGLKITEPAADLAVAAALISASKGMRLKKEMIFFGEVGLSGEVRRVALSEARIKEAEKLGFETAIIPTNTKLSPCKLDIKSVNHLNKLIDCL